MEGWKFVFEDATSEAEEIDSQTPVSLGSGTKDKPVKQKGDTGKKTFQSEFAQKGKDKAMEMFVISPLNQATGGLASPLYNTAKQLVSGTSNVGSVLAGGAVAIGAIALQKGIEALERRMQNLEKQASELNNNDNALLRAGSVSQATYYSANMLGVQKKTNRS